MNTKLLIGLALVGVGGYLLWKQNQNQSAPVKKNLASNTGTSGCGCNGTQSFVASLPAKSSKFRYTGDPQVFFNNKDSDFRYAV